MVLITAVPLEPVPDEYHTRGVTVHVASPVQQSTDPLIGHKTTCYWPRLQALHEAQQRGCAEALWFTETRQLAEGSISNAFIVKNGVLKTPPLGTPVLPGITRAVVLELGGELEIDTQECPLSIDDLLDADEVFLTNVIMQVVPVIRVEKHDIADGHLGPVTKKLMAAFRDRVRKECGDA